METFLLHILIILGKIKRNFMNVCITMCRFHCLWDDIVKNSTALLNVKYEQKEGDNTWIMRYALAYLALKRSSAHQIVDEQIFLSE